MTVSRRYTTADLEKIEPREGWRYEIIGGELHVTYAPSWQHQDFIGELGDVMRAWNRRTRAGRVLGGPGVVFNREDDVIPDLIWISNERIRTGTDHAGHFVVAPELVVEVLSPGSANERRDREIKLDLYSRQGVEEYWIVDWRARSVQLYRREDGPLALAMTLAERDILETPLLPGLRVELDRIWPPTI